MIKRSLTVVIGLPIVLLLVHLGGLFLVIFCAIIAFLGQLELYTAISGKGKPIHLLGYIFTGIYFAALYSFGAGYELLLMLTIFIILSQICLVVFFKKLTLNEIMTTVYGILYIPVLLAFIILTRELELGNYYVWLIFTSAFGCDTFAYLTGTTIGKHKLTGTPSPNKSIEGVLGGVVGAGAVGAVFGFFVTRFSGQFYGTGFIIHAAVISAIGAVFCVIGDMSASAIKRNTGIKDFGNVFPGHGGVMDRIDSIVLAAPVVFAAMTWLGTSY